MESPRIVLLAIPIVPVTCKKWDRRFYIQIRNQLEQRLGLLTLTKNLKGIMARVNIP